MTDIHRHFPAPGDPARLPQAVYRIQVFTDGCFDPVSKRGGWAFVAYRDGAEIAGGFGGAADSASNTMEVTALLEALLWINGNAGNEPALILSDSVHAVKGCNTWLPIWKNNRWKKIGANARVRSRSISDPELWKAIDLHLSRNPQITIDWCKGHSGIPGNERADELANHGRLSAAVG